MIPVTVISFFGFRLSYQSYKLSKESDGLSEDDFRNRLYHVIHPVYDAAKNSGFREWVYEGKLCQ